ncbi:MAG TPA: hypothetical protein VJN95_08705 [Gemmatimonadales bacterium]|nr:hypothetical protein [Gemmatimonadales bacterium]
MPYEELLPEWHRTPPAPKEIPLRRAVAWFCAVYPGAFEGGRITWPLFWALFEEMPSVQAMQRFHDGRAAMAGAAIVVAPKVATQLSQDDLSEALGS